jgi:hypothetical protein
MNLSDQNIRKILGNYWEDEMRPNFVEIGYIGRRMLW